MSVAHLKQLWKQHWFSIFALLILLIAATLRFSSLGAIPGSLYWDEAAMLVDAKSIAATGTDMHGRPWLQVMFPSYGDYKLPVYIWLSSVLVSVFDVSAFALRLTSAVAGLVTIAVAGVIGWRIGELLPDAAPVKSQEKSQRSPTVARLTALSSMLVVTLSPWSILFSRTAFEGHLAQCLVGISVAIVLWCWDRPWMRYIAALIGVLATYTYFSVRFIWPPLFLGIGIWWLIVHWKQRWRSLSFWRNEGVGQTLRSTLHTLLPLLLFVALLVPMLQSPLYEASNRFRLSTDSILRGEYALESNQLREIAGNTVLDRGFFHRHWLMIRAFLDNVADFIDPAYLFLKGDANLRHGTGYNGLFPLLFAPFFLLGLARLARSRQGLAHLFLLLLWWMLSVVPGAVPNETPHALRTLNALLPLSLLIGIGLSTALQYILKQHVVLRRSVLLIGALIAMLWTSLFWHHYTVTYNYYAAPSWQSGYTAAALAAESIAPDVDGVYLRTADNRLFLWQLLYGATDPAAFPDIPEDGFKITQIENIYFQQNVPKNRSGVVPSLQRFAVLEDTTGERESSVEEFRQSGFTLESEERLTDYRGVERFVLLVFARDTNRSDENDIWEYSQESL